jgi:hypothetical protein
MMEGSSAKTRLEYIKMLDERYAASQEELEAWSKFEGLTSTLQSSLPSSTVSVFEQLRLTLVRTEAEKTHAGYLKRYRKLLRQQREVEEYLRGLELQKAHLEVGGPERERERSSCDFCTLVWCVCCLALWTPICCCVPI